MKGGMSRLTQSVKRRASTAATQTPKGAASAKQAMADKVSGAKEKLGQKIEENPTAKAMSARSSAGALRRGPAAR